MTGPKTGCLTILRAATHETELGYHDFCFRRSHYTHTDPTSRERVATAEIEPRTSSPCIRSHALYRLSYRALTRTLRNQPTNQTYKTKAALLFANLLWERPKHVYVKILWNCSHVIVILISAMPTPFR